MKKIIFLSAMVFALACNADSNTAEGTGDTTKVDSTNVINESATLNDVPMRTLDTNVNLSADTMNVGDTARKP